MKKNWLNVLEYLLLVGSGVGSFATVASQQILYTTAPMSVLLLLNLVNRSRFDQQLEDQQNNAVAQLDQKVSADLTTLRQQIQALPSVLDLATLQKSMQANQQAAISELSQGLNLLKRELTKADWRTLRQESKQLQEQHKLLAESVANLSETLNQLGAANRLNTLEEDLAYVKADLHELRQTLQALGETQKMSHYRALQDQINQINRRLNKLPPSFDPTTLKQDMASLIKVVGDLASRRDLAQVKADMHRLLYQGEVLEQSIAPLKVATNILRKQMDSVASKVLDNADTPNSDALTALKATIDTLESRLDQLSTQADPKTLQTEIQTIVVAHTKQLQQQMAVAQQHNQALDRQQKALRDWVNRLPQMLDSTALQSEVKYLAARVEWAETSVNDLQSDVQAQIDSAIELRLDDLVQQLPLNPSMPEYELVFDLAPDPATSCRALLSQALAKAEARLIAVFPYPNATVLDDAMLRQFRQFLDRQGCLDLGWGHLGDLDALQQPRSIERRRQISPDKEFLRRLLTQLTQLKRDYPDQFRFKVLGTTEQFLVCDRTSAVLGAASISTASVVFPEAAVGLRTSNHQVIQGLVDRFDHPVLAENDAMGYFNRAATRYDLGDNPGAIADYSEVIRIQPRDDVALNNRGLARYGLGDRDGAIADFDQAVQHNPGNFIAYCNRGFLRSEMGDKMGAIEDYTYALQANPDYTTAYFYRGLARTRLQNKLGAIEDYTEVIQRNPQDAMAYFYRGLASVKIGQRTEALQDLHHAAHLFQSQGDLASYQQTIGTIKKLQKMVAIPAPEPTVLATPLLGNA